MSDAELRAEVARVEWEIRLAEARAREAAWDGNHSADSGRTRQQ